MKVGENWSENVCGDVDQNTVPEDIKAFWWPTLFNICWIKTCDIAKTWAVVDFPETLILYVYTIIDW